MARVVVLDRETGETFTEDIGDENPVAIYVPGRHAHGFEALTDLLFCYHVTEEYDPAAPDEQGLCWADPRVKHLWSTESPILSAARPGSVLLITGAGGQLGPRAGRGVRATTASSRSPRADWDVSLPPPPGLDPARLVLHAAAWTDVDGAEDDPQGAAAVNVGGTANVASLGAPLVYYSTDYVFDGREARAVRRVRRPEPALRLRSLEAPRRGRCRRAGLDRPLLLALRPDGPQLRPHDAAAGRRSGTRSRSSTTSAARRRTSATSPPRRAGARAAVRRLPRRRGRGLRPGPTSPRRSSRRPASSRRVRRISTAELGRPAPRPAYSVLRSEQGRARRCRHWRDGLRECLAAHRVAGRWRATPSSPPGSSMRRARRYGRRSTRSSAGRTGGAASRSVEKLEPGERKRRSGPLYRHEWRSVIPYPVRFETRITRSSRRT